MTTLIQNIDISPLINRFEEVAKAVNWEEYTLSKEVFGGTYNFAKIKQNKNLNVKTYNKAIQRLNEIEAARCPAVSPAPEEQSV
jgi:hypothetical protein